MNKLSLEVSLGKTDIFDAMEDTYRNEGLSVGQSYMNFQGQEILMEVKAEEITLGPRIGQGACSSVHLASHNITGKVYAVKLFNVYDSSQASQLLREIGLLSGADCEALVGLRGAFHKQGSIGLVLEYMDGGSLDSLLTRDTYRERGDRDSFRERGDRNSYRERNDRSLGEKHFAAIMFQVIWGLAYLHYENRLHRDVKPGNILFNSQGQVKISDFGISKELDSSSALSVTAVGTFKYMSPERLLGSTYDKSADVWSLAVMMVELWTKTHPFHYCCATPIDLIAELEVFDFDVVVSDKVFPKDLKEIIRTILKYEPSERWDCQQLLSSKWFTKFSLHSIADAQEVVKEWFKGFEDSGQKFSCAKSVADSKYDQSNNFKRFSTDITSLSQAKSSDSYSTSKRFSTSYSDSKLFSDYDDDCVEMSLSSKNNHMLSEDNTYYDEQFESMDESVSQSFAEAKLTPSNSNNRTSRIPRLQR